MVNDLTGWGNDNTFDFEVASGTPAGPLSKPAAAGVQGGVPAIAWVSERGIEVQFFSVLGDPTQPAEEGFSRVLVSPGTAKGDVQIADAVLAMGVAWQEESDAGLGVIKLRGVPAEGLPFGTELIVGGEEDDGFVHTSFNNHNLSIGGYDFATNVTITDPADPTDTIDVNASGINVAWVGSDPDDASGFGRIMLQRYQVVLDDLGDPVQLKAAGLDGQNELHAHRTSADQADLEATLGGPANDNAVWVGDEDGDGVGGVIGRDPAVAGLHTGDTLVAWLGADGHVHAKLYPPNGVVVASDAANDVGQNEYNAVNAALSDLTPALDADDIAALDGARRLKVVELGPGNFAIMWIVAAGANCVLQGAIFSTPPDTPAGAVLPDGWTKFDIAPIELRAGFTGEINLTGPGEDNANIVLTYTAGDGSGTGTYARHIDGADIAPGGRIGQSSAEFLVNTSTDGDANHQYLHTADSYHLQDQHHRLTGDVSPPPPQNSNGTPHTDPAGAETVLTPVGWAESQAVADNGFKIADSAASERTPIVKATEEAFITAWEIGDANAGPVSIRMSMYDPLGAATAVATGGTVIAVAEDADGRVSPAISGIGAGAVAAYVVADQGSLTLKAYDLDGVQVGSGIVVDTGAAGPISEIVVAAQAVEVAGVTFDDQFSVVYVQGPDAQGYGNVMLQRFGVPVVNDVPQSPIALGRDGAADGADVPVQLVVDSDGNPGTADWAVVVGRGVQAIGLHDGQLAVVWVEPRDSSGHETIRGTVIEPTGGNQVLRIDLMGMRPDTGIVEGTQPVLSAAGEGDILVSWLQADNDADGGFVVMAAHYKAAGPDAWAVPEAPIRLQEFANEPQEFSVSVVGEADVSVIVTWRENSSGDNHDVYGQRFDIDGHTVGQVFDVTGNRTGDGESQGSSDQSAAAGMLDGRFVVVYTEGNGDGDVDIEARIFDTRSAEAPSIGRDAGGPTGFEVGTVFDDIIDGGDGEDELHGGLGKDLLIGGANDDTLFGGAGDDTLIGGTGTDNLDGGAGNDLLMGSHGRDYITGGEGEDTISYSGEARAVDHEAEIFGFAASQDVENAEGGLGNDVIRGNDGANVLTGGGGNDALDGREGEDTAVFRGSRAEYIIARTADGWSVQDTVAERDGTDTLANIEHLRFLGDDSSLDVGIFQALDDSLATATGEPVLIEVLGNDAGAGRSIVQIAGVAVSAPGPGEVVPSVAVDNGFVQLRADGSLLFTPDNDFSGAVDFSYTIQNSDGAFAAAQVRVDVEPDPGPTGVSVIDAPILLETNGLGGADIMVGDIVVVDDGIGTLKGDGHNDMRDGSDGDNEVDGRAGSDTLVGGNGADTLEGGAGNDSLTGGDNNDTFVFRPGFGNDAVNQYDDATDDQAVIDLSSSGFATFEALQAADALAQVGPDVVITLNPADPVNSDKITLRSVTLSALDPTDFKFS